MSCRAVANAAAPASSAPKELSPREAQLGAHPVSLEETSNNSIESCPLSVRDTRAGVTEQGSSGR